MKKILFLLSLLFLAACTAQTGTTPTTDAPSVTPQVQIASPSYGSGKHTLMLFADFQCPACIQFSKVIGPVFEDYASRGYLKIVYKQYPLTSIHPNAERDAIAALCAAEEGKYMDYKKALYALEDQKK